MSESSRRNAPEFFKADIRSRIASDPSIVLDDPDVLMAIATAAEIDFGEKVYDMREVALSVLKERLDGHKKTHQKVIAATYENHVGTQNMHRAVLGLLEADSLDSALTALRDRLPEMLRVDAIRLVVEAESDAKQNKEDLDGRPSGGVVVSCPAGSVRDYLDCDPNASRGTAILRQVEEGEGVIYGGIGSLIRSEALLCLRPAEQGISNQAWSNRSRDGQASGGVEGEEVPWLLALGSRDPEQFRPGMGTDLITFFGDVLLRVLRRWLPS
ncbi:MAG: DUF484 family protein [Albidovulum sp.]|nr:DUF484 family protein [Albidovulum sp.]